MCDLDLHLIYYQYHPDLLNHFNLFKATYLAKSMFHFKMQAFRFKMAVMTE